MVKSEIEKTIRKAISMSYHGFQNLDFVVESPKNKEFGDYATNAALVLAKKINKPPREVADELMKRFFEIDPEKLIIEKVSAAGPGFINFELANQCLVANLKNILKEKDRYGSCDVGNGKVVIIDYSAVNIAKPMHVGHLRSTIIGQAIYNIYKFLGYKVIGDNHTGDWGTQFGKLIYAYKYWGDKKRISDNPIEEMTKLYVRFHKEIESDKNLEELARRETKKLQNMDQENIKIWKFLTKESLKDYNRIYKMLGVKFDYVLGESYYNDMLEGVVQECLGKKIAKVSQGAIVIDLERYNLPPFMIRKSDGAHLYTTTDLATVKFRKKKFRADIMLYVVANEQALHFKQLFATIDLLGWRNGIKTEHVKFGMVLAENGKKFSTRKGEAIRLEEVIKKSIDTAKNTIEKKNPSLSAKQKKKIARVVGIGGLKYNDLSQNRLTDITFNWERMLSFEGNSGPYLQYTYARINSLLEKYYRIYQVEKYNPFSQPNLNLIADEMERNIMRKLIKFSESIKESAKENAPHLIALYLYELASLYNNYYNCIPILKSEKNTARSRVMLSKAVSIVIKNGLGLLGIDVLEKI